MPDSDGSGAASTAVAGASGSQTVLEEEAEGERGAASPTVIKLKLKKPPATRRVQWTEDTVDNEHMNKKKSKCCCIYKKPLKFGESESEDSDSDCEHCSHHTPKDFIASRNGEREELPAADHGGNNGDGEHGDDDDGLRSPFIGDKRRTESRGGLKDLPATSSQTRLYVDFDSDSSRVHVSPSGGVVRKSQLRNAASFPTTFSSSSTPSCRHVTKNNTAENAKTDLSLDSSMHPIYLPLHLHWKLN